MSDISEDCYCAGWLGGTEHFIPELCRRALATQETQYWGHGDISPDLAARLLAIASELGHWVDTNFHSNSYEPFEPFPIPPQYLEALDREQLLSKQNRGHEKG